MIECGKTQQAIADKQKVTIDELQRLLTNILSERKVLPTELKERAERLLREFDPL
jgi:hypothetical protein